MSEHWREDAACKGEDPELFFPLSDLFAKQIAEAKSVCDRCPVRQECLDFATKMGLRHGIFGGITENKRRALSMQRR